MVYNYITKKKVNKDKEEVNDMNVIDNKNIIRNRWVNKWTEEELSYLRSSYIDIGYDELCLTLGRSKQAIKTKAYQLGLNKKNWSKEDIDFLKKNYSTMPIYKLEKELGKSANAIKLKASRLKIRKNNIYRY